MRKYKLIVLPQAELDVKDASIWYEEQQEGFGLKFAISFENRLNLLRQNPYLFPKVYNEARKALIKKFPYRIFYVVNEDKKEVVVHAVIHTRRDQKIWQKRVK